MLPITAVAVLLQVVVVTSSAKTDDSTGACNVDARSLNYDVDHMCDGDITELISVSHASKCDELVPQAQTRNQPTIRWKDAKPSETYTVVMIDPDAPHAGSTVVFWVHWIVSGVTGEALRNGEMDGKVLAPFSYSGPTPPPGTGTHRYEFYVFESTGKDVITSQKRRGGFSLVEFVSENNFCRCVARFQYRVNPVS